MEKRPFLSFDPMEIPGYDRLEGEAWKATREESSKARIVADIATGRIGGGVHNQKSVEVYFEAYRAAAYAAERARGIRDQCYDAYSEYLKDDHEIWMDRED